MYPNLNPSPHISSLQSHISLFQPAYEFPLPLNRLVLIHVSQSAACYPDDSIAEVDTRRLTLILPRQDSLRSQCREEGTSMKHQLSSVLFGRCRFAVGAVPLVMA